METCWNCGAELHETPGVWPILCDCGATTVFSPRKLRGFEPLIPCVQSVLYST